MVKVTFKIKEIYKDGIVGAVTIKREEKGRRATKREILVAENLIEKAEGCSCDFSEIKTFKDLLK